MRMHRPCAVSRQNVREGMGRTQRKKQRDADAGDEQEVHAQVENLRRWLRTYAQAEQSGHAAPLTEPVLAHLEETIEALRVSDDDLRLHLDTMRRNAARMEQERARYRELLDLSPDAYLLTDLEGTIVDANAAAAELLGIERADLTRRPFSAWVDAEDKPIFWEWLADLQTAEQPLQWEMRLRARGDTQRHVVVRARHASEAPELRWMLRDISERIRAEETERRLRQERAERQAADYAAQQARFLARAGRLLNESVGAAAVAEAVVETAVPTLGRVALLDTREMDGRDTRYVAPAGELSGRLSQPASREPGTVVGAVLQSGELDVIPFLSEAQREQIAPGAGGVLEELNLHAAVLVPLKRKNVVIGVLTLLGATVEECSARDLLLGKAYGENAALALDNARLLVEARASSRAKSDFIGYLSHEFRTPLTSVLGYADLLEAETGGPLTDMQRRQLRRLRAGAWHLSRLVDDTLAYSREVISPPALELESIDVRQLAVECVHSMRPTAAEGGLTLELAAPAHPVTIRSDTGRVRQILLNLIDNAIKFTVTGGVRLHVLEQGDHVQIDVHDTGVGIPARQVDRIFQPFHQLDVERGGSGLGLTAARQLAWRLGGEISVSSTEGVGTTFTVRLPRDLQPAQ